MLNGALKSRLVWEEGQPRAAATEDILWLSVEEDEVLRQKVHRDGQKAVLARLLQGVMVW